MFIVTEYAALNGPFYKNMLKENWPIGELFYKGQLGKWPILFFYIKIDNYINKEIIRKFNDLFLCTFQTFFSEAMMLHLFKLCVIMSRSRKFCKEDPDIFYFF